MLRSYTLAAEFENTVAHRRRPWLIYALTVGLYFVVFALWQVEPVPWEVHLVNVVLWAICLFPLARWYGQGHEGLPMFEFICVAYGLQFSMPIYLEPNIVSTTQGLVPTRWESVLFTLFLTMAGVLALIAGYYLAQRWRLLQLAPHIDLQLEPARRSIYLALAFGLGLLALYLQLSGDAEISDTLNAIIGVFANQFRLALIILAYVVYGSSQRRFLPSVILYGFLALGVMLGLISGLLENALIPVILMVLVYWQAKGRIPVRLIAVGFLGFIILNAAKGSYRTIAWYGDQQLDPAQRLSLWLDLGQNVVTSTSSGDAVQNTEDLIRTSMARFDLEHKFAYVSDMTPRLIPYYEGQTYSYLLVAWIPRLIWPDKPDASESNHRLDIDYSLLYPQQILQTVIPIGQLPEAYANYGPLGVVVVMFLQGLVFSVINHVFNDPRSDGGRAIYLSTMVFFLNGIGSSVVVLFGALAQNLLANTLILRLFATGFQSRPEQSSLLPAESPSLVTDATKAHSQFGG